MPSAERLSDSEAKTVLLSWPTATGVWGAGTWLRGQPVVGTDTASGPRLKIAGTRRFQTQPDGMWLMVPAVGAIDVIAVEVCGSVQNLHDKRSRYAPSGSARVVTLTERWLDGMVPVPGRGAKARRNLIPIGAGESSGAVVPVRHLRVLFAVPAGLYVRLKGDIVPAPHEFFTQHSSLRSRTSQKMQAFFRRMTVAAHFYP